MKKFNFQRIKILLSEVKKDVSLKEYTSFKIGGKAKYFLITETKEELIRAISAAKKLNLPFFVLGAGTNLLVSDKGFDGLVIKIENKKISIDDSKIIVEPGMPLTKLAGISADKGLTGLEWASGIPGTVGGAVRGNAGAFGGCMANAVKKATILDYKTLAVKKINNKACRFGYRESIFKQKKFFILEVELILKIGNRRQIMKKIKECLDYRSSRHPKNPSAGSIFKNVSLKIIPEKFFQKMPEAKEKIKENVLPSAFLIAKSGLVGKKIGGAMVSREHPNFVINHKNAKSRDVKRLINFIKKTIKNKFGIILEEEIMYL